MENDHIKHILEQLESGKLTASDAYDQLKLAPFEDLGYAKVCFSPKTYFRILLKYHII